MEVSVVLKNTSYTNNWKRLSVPCYFLAPCDKHKHTAHTHQQAASQVSTDSTWRRPVWLPHSSLRFQCPVGRRSYRLTPQLHKTRLWLENRYNNVHQQCIPEKALYWEVP